MNTHLNRDPFAQPVPRAGGPMPSLRMDTGLPGLVHASLAHVYPDDRGVSKALGPGRRAADQAIAATRAARATTASDPATTPLTDMAAPTSTR